MTLYEFEKIVNPVIVKRGYDYYKDDRVRSVYKLSKEKELYSCEVRGSHVQYTVRVSFSEDMKILNSSCNCPYYGEHCKHAVASWYKLREIIKNTRTKSDVARLIAKRKENPLSISDLSDENADGRIVIIPDFKITSDTKLSCTLKIGKKKQKLYMVKDIEDLKINFEYNYPYRYGKDLAIVHSYSELDKETYMLFNFIAMCNSENSYSKRKEVVFTPTQLDGFFNIYKKDELSMGALKVSVVHKDPSLKIALRKSSNGYVVENKCNVVCLGAGLHGYYFDKTENKLYISSVAFSRAVSEFFILCQSMKEIMIYEDEIGVFYTSILKPCCKYIKIIGDEILSEIIPPEMVPELYVDINQQNHVVGKLIYRYGEKTYSAFGDEGENNPFCDYAGEQICKNNILDYFDTTPSSKFPIAITEESDIYEFLKEGLSELSKTMEIYMSDSFKKVSVRPPVRTVVGVRPSACRMLELEITADGYTSEELISMLLAYRKGKKYHRLKDGSFGVLDDTFFEFSEFMSNLNISDKNALLNKIEVPEYRMLYLDSLRKNGENLRIKRSGEFKKMVKGYNLAIEDAEETVVPSEMEETMREYQKYGFRWLKTISSYGFGGILADDMGLGKTIQAISLLLDEKNRSETHYPSIVVCPSSLTLNWENEVKKFAPSLSTLVISGNLAARDELFERINDCDLVITSYSLIGRDIEKYKNINFRFHFIDEAQYIKNHNTLTAKAVKSIKSEIRFALTGTPVENSLAELWSIFDFIMRDYLFGYSHFKKTFETPIVSKNDTNSVKALQKLVSPFILRRLKKEVLTELPDKTETILYAQMESEQSKLYSANVAQIKSQLKNNTDDGKGRIEILAMLTRLRQICCDPSLVYEDYKGESAKLQQCLELVESCVCSGHKVLLFSQFTSMLDIIANELNKREIGFYSITGKTKSSERIKLVNRFNEDDTGVFLISLKAGGTGLNLTGADIVIHYDPWWNISAENQASDRAYRIGQKRNVQVYKLIVRNTIEENIRRLQQSKAELYDIAVSGEGDIMHMSAEEIIEILE